MLRLLVLLPMVAAGLASPAGASAADRGGLLPPSAIPVTLETEADERHIVDLVNAARARHGLRPLRVKPALRLAGRSHAADMVLRNYFSHTSPGGFTPAARIAAAGYRKPRRRGVVGETIAWGLGPFAAPAAIVDGWMSSPAHRAIILTRRFRAIGVGVVTGTPSASLPAGSGTTVAATFGRLVRVRRH